MNVSFPLAGVRVLDLSTMLSGPFGTMMLGDMGAEIIKIETMEGDNTRTFPPHFHGEDSLYYLANNRNKKSVVLDLKNPEGLALFYALVRHADVVWDNFRAGVKYRLKIDYDTLKKINPDIICCSISAYGDKNPYDRYEPTYDLCIQAMSGVLNMTGEPERPPVKLGIPMADLAGGWYGVVGVLAALFSKEKTGQGQKVDISMLDGLTALHNYEGVYNLNTGSMPERLGTSHRSLVPYQIFSTADQYIAIVVARDKFWQALCRAIDHTEWIEDERFATIAARYENRETVVKLLEEVLAKKNCGDWLESMRREGVPCAPVNSLSEVFKEPLLLSRDMVVDMPHADGSVKVLGNPIKMSQIPSEGRYCTPPALGEHTRDILESVLRMSPERIDDYCARNIIFCGKEE